METKIFTSQQLLDLIARSAAVKAMLPTEVFNLVEAACDADGKNAKKIYKVLVEEQRMDENIKKNFEEYTKKVMSDLETGIIELKKAGGKSKMKKLQQDAKKESDQMAEGLLKGIV